jgi:hypothetical protein
VHGPAARRIDPAPHDYGVVIILMGMIDGWCRPIRWSRCGAPCWPSSTRQPRRLEPGRATHLFEAGSRAAAALPSPHGLMQLV